MKLLAKLEMLSVPVTSSSTVKKFPYFAPVSGVNQHGKINVSVIINQSLSQ